MKIPYRVLIATLVLSASGCAQYTAGNPGAPATATPAPQDRSYGAPDLTQPPLTQLPNSPCKLIKPRQWKLNGLTGERENRINAAGRNCRQHTPDRYSRTVSVRILDSPSGLRGMYSRKENNAVFQEVSISQYPAVLTKNTQQDASCRITVLANDETLLVTTAFIQGDTKRYDPCELSKKFARYAVQNLKEKG